jgi:Tol biopolymer transport system component
MSPKEGSFDVYIVSATGEVPKRLTTESWDERPQGWSNDGRWFYYRSNRSGSYEVWKMPLEGGEGGEAIQITKNGGARAYESPDGRFLYFGKGLEGPRGIWRVPVDGGEEVQVLEHAGRNDWAVTQDGIYYVNRETEPGPAFELLEFATGKVRAVTVLDRASIWGFAVSPDKRWILYNQTERVTDIMLVENFR